MCNVPICSILCRSVSLTFPLYLSYYYFEHFVSWSEWNRRKKNTSILLDNFCIDTYTFCPLWRRQFTSIERIRHSRSTAMHWNDAVHMRRSAHFISIRVNCLFIHWNSYVVGVSGPCCTPDGEHVYDIVLVPVLCFHKHKSIDSHCNSVDDTITDQYFRVLFFSVFFYLTVDAFWLLLLWLLFHMNRQQKKKHLRYYVHTRLRR